MHVKKQLNSFLRSALVLVGIVSAQASHGQDSIFVSAYIENLDNQIVTLELSVQLTRGELTSKVVFNRSGWAYDSFALPTREVPGMVTGKFIDCDGKEQEAVVQRPTLVGRSNYQADLKMTYCEKEREPDSCNAFFAIRQAIRGENNPVTNQLVIYEKSFGSGLTYDWDFGDGNTSRRKTPTHTYLRNGPYNICLRIADTTGCFDTLCEPIGVDSNGLLNGKRDGFSITVINGDPPSSIDDVEQHQRLTIFPNPSSGLTYIQMESTVGQTVEIRLYQSNGCVVAARSEKLDAGVNQLELSTTGLNKGIYWVEIIGDGGRWSSNLIKK